MHCYKCENTIEVTGGIIELPLYDFTKQSYYSTKIAVIECPYCRELIGITNFNLKEITEQIKVDSNVQGK